MLLVILNNNNIINHFKIVIKHKDDVNVSIYKLIHYLLFSNNFYNLRLILSRNKLTQINNNKY